MGYAKVRPAQTAYQLAINGQTYGLGVSVPEDYAGGHPSGQASVVFAATTSGWEIYKQGWLVPMTVLASGSLPSGTGAVSVMYSMSAITQSGDKPATSVNQAPTKTTLSGSLLSISLSSAVIRGTTSDISDGRATVTVNYYDAAGNLVATATFTFYASAAGSA